jgi:hypothetical protein
MGIDLSSLSSCNFTFVLQHDVFLSGIAILQHQRRPPRTDFHRILPDTVVPVDTSCGSLK